MPTPRTLEASPIPHGIAMDANKSHFPHRHYEGRASGPFALLNPTVRRFPLVAPKPDVESPDNSKDHGADAQAETGRPTAAKDEARADDVQRQWRSRDNRKGEWSYRSRAFNC